MLYLILHIVFLTLILCALYPENPAKGLDMVPYVHKVKDLDT
jgi:hypothetical protein